MIIDLCKCQIYTEKTKHEEHAENNLNNESQFGIKKVLEVYMSGVQ